MEIEGSFIVVFYENSEARFCLKMKVAIWWCSWECFLRIASVAACFLKTFFDNFGTKNPGNVKISFLLIPSCCGWFWVVPHFIKKVKTGKARKKNEGT